MHALTGVASLITRTPLLRTVTSVGGRSEGAV